MQVPDRDYQKIIAENEQLKLKIQKLEKLKDRHKKAADRLRDSEEKYFRIFRTSPDVVSVTRLRDGMYIEVNDQYVRQMGYTREESLGRTSFSQGIWVDLADRRRMVEILSKQEEVQEEEYRFRCKDGRIIIGEMSARLIRIKGEPCLFCMIRDITEKIELRRAQRESEEKYRLLTEQSLMGMAIIQDARIKFANQAIADITGYSREEMLNWEEYGFAVLFHPAEKPFIMEQVRKKQSGDQDVVIRYEWRLIAKSGAVRWVESFSKTLSFGGQPADFLIMLDVTDREEAKLQQEALEERLNRAEKMEALGLLAGGVAHDLNNVLGVIIGYAELLMKGVDEKDPLGARLATIMKSSERATAIVQDLLTLARRGVTGGQILDLNRIVKEFQTSPEREKLASYHPTVRFKIDLAPDLLHVAGSAIHLVKTLFNLVSNAAEAMPDGGLLTISTVNRYLDKPLQGYDEVREGDYVVLAVADEGKGISAGDMQRIFEPFYTKKVMGRSGTGLGLSVVWGVVKDHSGYVNVESVEGKGSTFTLYFPVARKRLTAAPVSVPAYEYIGNGETILVVDDIKEQRELAAAMLESLRYQVTVAASGAEAVAHLKKHKVNLLVLDMIMDPGPDGLDTYKKILKINPRQKAVIVSGYSESERVNAAQALGAGAYVRKPYIIETLGLAVRRELDKK